MKRLILVRHAHRDTTHRDADNGLSEKGWAQAHALAEHFARSFKAEKPVLLSSERVRCQETLEPIARLTGVKVRIDSRLLEQESGESFADFAERIEAFIEDWKAQAPALTVACSHGDWLPTAIEELTGTQTDMKKGAWAELILTENRVKLECLIQKF